MTSFLKTMLDSGLRVLSERVESASSVALGIWVAAGSRDLILRELCALRQTQPTAEELREAVNFFKTSLIPGNESTESRMSRLGRNGLAAL